MADRALRSIINDRTSGAGEIERRIHVFLMSALRIYRNRGTGELVDAIAQIRRRFNAMANIVKILDMVSDSVGKKDFDSIRENLASYRKVIEENRQSTIDTAAAKICRYNAIFTLSYSTAINRAISGAGQLDWQGGVNVAESRPRNEGTMLASDLARMGIPSVLAIDANIPELVKASKAIFLGADAVTPTYFVNKTGSAIAMEYAAKYHKPIYVVADISKYISDKKYKFIPDENPTKEIISGKLKNLTVLNNYFEKIIPQGKTQYICGGEIINPADVKNLLKRRL